MPDTASDPFSKVRTKLEGTLEKAAGKTADDLEARLAPSKIRIAAPWVGGAIVGSLLTVWAGSATHEVQIKRLTDSHTAALQTKTDELKASQDTLTQTQATLTQVQAGALTPNMLPTILRGRDTMMRIEHRIQSEHNQVFEGTIKWVETINSVPELQRQLSRIGAESRLANPLETTVYAGDNKWLPVGTDGKVHLLPHTFYGSEVNLHTGPRQAHVARGLKAAEADSANYPTTRVTYMIEFEAAKDKQGDTPATPESVKVIRNIAGEGAPGDGEVIYPSVER